jgi:hypothetical protein
MSGKGIRNIRRKPGLNPDRHGRKPATNRLSYCIYEDIGLFILVLLTFAYETIS